MTTSIYDQEFDMRGDYVKSEIPAEKSDADTPIVYFRLGEDNPLLTWTGLYKPHQS
jgi:hypothetical protein